MSVQRSTIIFAWILLLPAVLYVTVIVAYPLVDTFILSFTDASLKKTTKWVGPKTWAGGGCVLISPLFRSRGIIQACSTQAPFPNFPRPS